jgi:hypothetical protein
MVKTFLNIIHFIVPKILFDFICYLIGNRHFKISYSQSAEDLILLKYLNYKKIRKGKYLDIGAFHPQVGLKYSFIAQKGIYRILC